MPNSSAKQHTRYVTRSCDQERQKAIQNGIWMPRGHSIPSGKHLSRDRKHLRKELKDILSNLL